MKVLVDGNAEGEVLVLDEPLSFWGGVDVQSGVIIEAGHPQAGESVADRIVIMPRGRGSSSSASVVAELLRTGKGPAGLVLEEPDSILVVGVLVATELYGAVCPVIVDSPGLGTGDRWSISG